MQIKEMLQVSHSRYPLLYSACMSVTQGRGDSASYQGHKYQKDINRFSFSAHISSTNIDLARLSTLFAITFQEQINSTGQSTYQPGATLELSASNVDKFGKANIRTSGGVVKSRTSQCYADSSLNLEPSVDSRLQNFSIRVGELRKVTSGTVQ